MEISISINGKEIQIVNTVFESKINSNGGAAPWMIGRTVKSSRTCVFIDGVYKFDFPFSFKNHKKGGWIAKNQIDQLSTNL